MTNAQYVRAIDTLFSEAQGIFESEGPLRVLPGGEAPYDGGPELEPLPEVSVDGFYNDLDSQAPNSLTIGRLGSNATLVSQEVLDRSLEFIFDDDQEIPEDGLSYVLDLASRAWRVPPEHSSIVELNEWLVADIPEHGLIPTLDAAIAWIVASPRFVYVLDEGRDPAVLCADAQPAPRATATRLALTLWGDLPDVAVLEPADNGQLESSADVRAVAAAMLEDERAAGGLSDFATVWLKLVGFETAIRQTPGGQPIQEGDAVAFIEQAQTFVVQRVLEEGGTLQDLFTSPQLPVDARTARLHENAPTVGEGWTTFDGTAEGRAGVLTLPAVLSRGANDLRGSPVKRGYFVIDRLLCTAPPPPPADVDTSLPPASSGPQTNRERYSEHQANSACSGCHQSLDPLGFPFEHFNASGEYQELEPWWDGTELGSDFTIEELLPIDASVDLENGAGGHFQGLQISGPADLAAALAESEAAHSCFAQSLATWALGRPVLTIDGGPELVDELAALSLSGAPVTDLLLEIVTDDLFLVPCAQ